MPSVGDRRRLLLVGGGGGLVGRAVVNEFAPTWAIRSVHRSFAPNEREAGVEWIAEDLCAVRDWAPLLAGVDVVLNVAWYRAGSHHRFETLYEGLHRLIEAVRGSDVSRVLQVSVPPSTPRLERSFPYLVFKRRIDREVAESGRSFRVVRPTMMFGERDVLLTVMLREIDRYPFFPMFGDGRYHVSPVWVHDVARILRHEAEGAGVGTIDVGGPVRYEYRALTDLLFDALGKRARYWSLSPGGGRALARLLETFGSTLLYAYEVEWLTSDLLGLSPYETLDRPLRTVDSFVAEQVKRHHRVRGVGSSPASSLRPNG